MTEWFSEKEFCSLVNACAMEAHGCSVVPFPSSYCNDEHAVVVFGQCASVLKCVKALVVALGIDEGESVVHPSKRWDADADEFQARLVVRSPDYWLTVKRPALLAGGYLS